MIRPATKKDIARIAEILIFSKRTNYRSIFQNDIVSFNEMQVIKLIKEYEKDDKLLENIEVYDDGILKGMINCKKSTKTWEIQELYVDPFFVNSGIGTMLMINVLQKAVMNKAKRIYLWVLEENHKAIHFYQDLGFINTSIKKEFQNTGKNVLMFSKTLKTNPKFKIIDMNSYRRKKHFEYFQTLAYPYVGVNVNVEITSLLHTIKEKSLPFFLTICYCVSKAANKTKEFRQRIYHHQIIEFYECRTSHTIALDNETYCYCDLKLQDSYQEYIAYAQKEQEFAKENHSIEENEIDSLDKFYISSLPWLSYTSIINPTPVPADSNPRITWGKYFSQNEQIFLPVSVLCHHALVDGIHIAKFYDHLNQEIQAVETEITRNI